MSGNITRVFLYFLSQLFLGPIPATAWTISSAHQLLAARPIGLRPKLQRVRVARVALPAPTHHIPHDVPEEILRYRNHLALLGRGGDGRGQLERVEERIRRRQELVTGRSLHLVSAQAAPHRTQEARWHPDAVLSLFREFDGVVPVLDGDDSGNHVADLGERALPVDHLVQNTP